LFCYRYCASERIAHRRFTTAIRADHRGADAMQFSVPPDQTCAGGHRQGAVNGAARVRNSA
jgi:hypothetical protein